MCNPKERKTMDHFVEDNGDPDKVNKMNVFKQKLILH